MNTMNTVNVKIIFAGWLPSGWLPYGWLPSGRLPIWLFACGSACAMCLDMLIMYVCRIWDPVN